MIHALMTRLVRYAWLVHISAKCYIIPKENVDLALQHLLSAFRVRLGPNGTRCCSRTMPERLC